MYRVWDQINNRWLTDFEDVYLNPDGAVFVAKKGRFGRIKLEKAPVGCTLHHGTGLADMVGMPIFEGDLLEVIDVDGGNSEVGVVAFEFSLGQYIVLIDRTSTWYPLNQDACGKLTRVIGNVFEGRWDKSE